MEVFGNDKHNFLKHNSSPFVFVSRIYIYVCIYKFRNKLMKDKYLLKLKEISDLAAFSKFFQKKKKIKALS